jgi:hypothetical protein
LIDVFQAVPSLHRDCDWRDWMADTIAVGVALVVLKVTQGWAGRLAAATVDE